MPEVDFDACVIGAGVVGLAVARELAVGGRSVLVLERHPGIGQETSSRNSEVIHAGLYYTPNSLKARLCVEGKQRLYDYCEQRNVPFRRCGKLLVATSEGELKKLSSIMDTAIKNGVNDLRLLTADQARAMEPEVNCVAAAFSPSTGIIGSHDLMLAYQGDLEAHGGTVALRTAFIDSERVGDVHRIRTRSETGEEFHLDVRVLVNSAGLGAADVARSIIGLDERHIYPVFPTKGVYFSLEQGRPFKTLVYPMPVDGGLGVHATIDLGGRVKFGPDVEWGPFNGYAVDPAKAGAFKESIGCYWPGVAASTLVPDYAGYRPKLATPSHPGPADFVVEGPEQHGYPDLVNLFGIESPGLTSSLAIASLVGGMLH